MRTDRSPLLKGIVLVACSWAICSAAHASAFAFKAPSNFRLGTVAAVAVADVDGDGRDDLAAISDGHLKVSLQQPNGSLGAALDLTIPSANFLVVKAVDLGADGSRELLVGHDHGLAIYHWGSGGFVVDDRPAAYPCRTMAAADINSDGAPDVLCFGTYGDALLYYSDPTTVLSAPQQLMTAAPAPGQAQLKDVSGDGKPDLLLASTFANSFFVYPNNGVGSFFPAVAYPYVQEAYLWSGAIEALDVDGDGANEVAVATPCNKPCSNVYLYRRLASGYLTLAQRIPTYDSPIALLAADLDHDGREDLLVGHGAWYAVGRYMGSSGGLSGELRSLAAFDGNANGLAVGDLNHDGYTDVAASTSSGVAILYGGRPVATDFNGDFVSDLLWHHSAGSNAIWLSADTANQYGIGAQDPAWSIETVADFDGDGLDDVFWRNRTTGADEVWLYGSGAHMPVATVTSQDWQVVAAGDFDGDGRADLFWRNNRTGANVIWKSGDSSTQQATTAVTDLAWAVVGVGDFDNDGQADVLWRHATSGSNAIWLSGRYASRRPITAVTNPDWKVAGIGDFDGDKQDDIVWRNVRSGANAIWRSADATRTQAVTAVTNLAWGIAGVGDYDGDGRSDLLWRNSASGANVIWRAASAAQQQSVAGLSDPQWKSAP